MSGYGNGYGGGGRNADEQPDQQQYDSFGNPLPRSATHPTGSFLHALPQSGMPGYAGTQPPNMLVGGVPQQAPHPYVYNPSQQMGGHQGHLSQAMPPQHGHHGALPPNSSIHRAMTPPWPSFQGVMYGQQPSYPTMQNSLQPSAGVPLPPFLPQGAFPQPSSASTSAINQSHTFGNSAFNMQHAVSAPPFVPNPPVLPDPAAAFDDDYIHPRTGRPTRAFLSHEQALLRQYYRLKHPLAPNATDREMQMWHIRLRSTELTAWDKFVADNESKSQAVERSEAIKEYEEWIKDIKQSMRDEIRSEARGNVYNRLGRAPGSKNKPKTAPPAKGSGVKKGTSRKGGRVLKGKKSKNELDSDDEEEDDDDNDAEDDDEGDTIIVEVPTKGKSKGKGRAATQRKSASASKTKNSSKQAAAEAFEEDANEEAEMVEENYEDISGQEDLEDVDSSGADMEFTEDN